MQAMEAMQIYGKKTSTKSHNSSSNTGKRKSHGLMKAARRD
jgi:hypothetical protein